MLDIKFIRENTEKVKASLERRGVGFDLAALLAADEKRRAAITEGDGLRARQNAFAEEIARSPAGERAEKIAASRELKARLAAVDEETRKAEEEFFGLMHQLPNIPLPDVPEGRDERNNVVLREVGDKPRFDFPPRDYMEIATRLSLVDTERAAKVSGSRFGYIKSELARLEFALAQFAFDRLTQKGFIPIVPPVMVREDMMAGMGYIDTNDDREERYFLEKDKLFLVGTSEQSVAPMHADETFDAGDLPRRYAAFSTCFRREAGSYGKDTRGILRSHQFDKMEMVSFTRPEDSQKEHEFLLAREEELMQALRLPYRVVRICAGDMARPTASQFDIETWFPGQNNGKGEYRETHSTSNTTDFQARRLNIKYRPTSNLQPLTSHFVHILNGTAFAVGRTLIAILENYQRADGSVAVPEALQPYMGGMRVITKTRSA